MGNGRLGAMVRGNPFSEIIQLNEESVWSGGPQNRNNPDALKNIPGIRSLIQNGKVQAAQELCYETLTGTPPNERVYQTAGEIHIDFYTEESAGIIGPLPDHTVPSGMHAYSRSLDMKNAVAVCRYRDGADTEFVRSVYVSAPDDILVMHVTASKPGCIYFRAVLDRGIWCDRLYSAGKALFLEDSHGIPFCTGIAVKVKGGTQNTAGGSILVSGADEAVFFADVRTAFNMWKEIPQNDAEYRRMCLENVWTEKCMNSLRRFSDRFDMDAFDGNISALFERHRSEYTGWYGRMSFTLGGKKESVSTPELLASASADTTGLVEAYCNFGRYLLISCSRRPGKLPATLQGLWNKDINPP